MGGRIIETQTEIWMKQGEAKMIVEMGQEDGLSDEVILNRLQKNWSIT